MAKKPRGPTEIKLDTKTERLLVPAAKPLAEICGHAGPKRVLMDAMTSGRVHHCWIFQGPLGVGKCTTAMAFASLLLDSTSAPDFSGAFVADESSTVHRLLRSGSHPDLHLVVKELAAFHSDPQIRKSKQRSISVEVVRDFLIDPAGMAPNLGSGGLASKVFIVDEAELLNLNSQNALLKTLEEPPAKTVLILVTTNEELLLPTIRSRSQRISFAPLAAADMRRWVSTSEESFSDADAEWLISFSDGAPGHFVSACELKLHEWWERMAPMLRAAEKGEHRAELASVLWECVDAYATGWVEMHPHASKEAANRAGADWVFRILAWWARDSMPRMPLVAAARIDAIRDAERRLEANVNGLFAMEELVGRITAAATVSA